MKYYYELYIWDILGTNFFNLYKPKENIYQPNTIAELSQIKVGTNFVLYKEYYK
jgi:hypothetical protein